METHACDKRKNLGNRQIIERQFRVYRLVGLVFGSGPCSRQLSEMLPWKPCCRKHTIKVGILFLEKMLEEETLRAIYINPREILEKKHQCSRTACCYNPREKPHN